ncbi:alpha/beta hydrolase family protein [Winogradskyella epiphytica]|uniref:Alpha/beta hydrolase family protein n=1 Tax=Winogradskyella epiphytica TaxID=262005 RepID=A0A2V4XD09_9FLAO|nr:alpha/beta hydrolase [Winogradskyella epiphytica]PYE80425.1 alpha/beta hydrolase family protein [Winogradskyella epiphytica]GGW69557.1 alpha/beta hydrolase [Winogradskyella epiphytica]
MSSIVIKTVGSAVNASSFVSSKFAAKKALKLFASPRKGRYTEDQKLLVETALQDEIRYNNMDIATYRWAGKGKTILLAHGWESNTARWSYILNDFKAQDYNIVSLDAPAHGRSSGKQFTAIMYAEFINVVAKKYKPDVLIGHSVGAMSHILSLYQNELPSVEKVVLLGAPAHFTGVFDRYKNMMGYNNRVSSELDKIIMERFGKPVSYFSTAQFTESIDAKGLIIHDKKDRIIPYEDAQLIAHRYKNSQLISTNGFGHGLKDPSLTPQIIEFINT